MIRKANDNLDGFIREVDQFVDRTVPEKVVQVQQKLSMDALTRIVMRTPVDKGLARGNWQATIGTPAGGVLTRTRKSASPPAKELRTIDQLQPYQVLYITNNLDYILTLEYGGYPKAPASPGHNEKGDTLTVNGWSRKLVDETGEPIGMVTLTKQELDKARLDSLQ